LTLRPDAFFCLVIFLSEFVSFDQRRTKMSTQASEVYVGKKVPSEHVSRLKLRGVHNCCGPCNDAIRDAIWTVSGVTSDTAEPGNSDFEVMGDFSPAELIEALHGAGFHAEIEA
jgi:copper chaperone CopZ